MVTKEEWAALDERVKHWEDHMMHEGKRIDEEVKRLERELEQPISPERRRAVQEAISHLRRKKQAWASPH
jgi:hypothetical protein